MDDKREMKKLERWQTICKEASEQSKRMNIPVVTNITKLSDLKMDGLKILARYSMIVMTIFTVQKITVKISILLKII